MESPRESDALLAKDRLAEPVEVYVITGAGTVRSCLQASAATKFVGRTAELQQLDQALERARGGQGQVVAAVGEPGVGKSRAPTHGGDASA
jgi:transcriptional regulator with AAA-type ATPase domain